MSREKLEHKVAKSTALVTVALFLSFFRIIVGGIIQEPLLSLSSKFGDVCSEHIFGHLNSVTNPGSPFQKRRTGDFEH